MSNGLVVREGAVSLIKVKRYAKSNKLPFIDLRENFAFTDNNQLSTHLSMRVSRALRRPIRVSIESFFKGEAFGNKFVAVLPHDFVHEYVFSNREVPKQILNFLTSHEARLA